MNIWIVLIITCSLVYLYFAHRSMNTRKCLSALHRRESLSDEEIYTRFYAESGLSMEAVMDVWHEIAHVLRAPADRLRPSDRFGKDVGTYLITSEDLDVLGVVALRRGQRQGLSVQLDSIETIDDYVNKLAPRSQASKDGTHSK